MLTAIVTKQFLWLLGIRTKMAGDIFLGDDFPDTKMLKQMIVDVFHISETLNE